MKWNRFTLKTKTEAEDIVICTLAEVGIEGVEIQDKQPLTDEDKAQMFVDIMPEGPADDGIAYLNFYLEEDADTEAILKDVKAALEDLRSFVDIGEATITESQTEGVGSLTDRPEQRAHAVGTGAGNHPAPDHRAEPRARQGARQQAPSSSRSPPLRRRSRCASRCRSVTCTVRSAPWSLRDHQALRRGRPA